MVEISHTRALEQAFEQGNLKILISKIIDILEEEKNRIIFYSIFRQEDGIFYGILGIYDTVKAPNLEHAT